MHNSRKKYSFVIIIALLVLSVNITRGQSIIKNVLINPLNRASIYFSQLPSNYSSELSADKLKIVIRIPSASVEDKYRKNKGNGIIDNIYVQSFSKNLEISIILKDKRGYTIAQLPYSQALMIEVFDWAKLTPDEDNYRSGLLAMENGIYKTAKQHFKFAYNKGNANAGVFLAIILLKQGYIDDALHILENSEKKGANIPDLYAALSQIYKEKKDLSRADSYKRIFKEKTGLDNFKDLLPSSLTIEDSTGSDYSLLSKMNNPNVIDSAKENKDTSNNISNAYNTNTDSIKKTLSSNLSQNQNEGNDFLTDWMKYAAIFAGLLFIVLITSYLKWRKNQVSRIRKQRSNEFKENLKTAQGNFSGTSTQAAKAYTKAGKLLDKTTPKNENPPVKMSNPKVELTEKAISDSKDNKESLERIAKEIIASKAQTESYSSDFSEDIEFDEEIIAETEKPKPVNAKLELALHLQEEQKRIKQQNLESLKAKGKDFDYSKLNEVAKRLGIEKGAVEASKTIAKLETDKTSLNKLAEKFSKREEK